MGEGRRVALVTGASTGIGRATGKALVKAGWQVYGTSRRPVDAVVDGMRMVACDVTDDSSVQEAVQTVLANGSGVELLVNNAGVGLLGGLEESSSVQAHAIFDVNVLGVVRMIKAVLPTMRQQGSGRIVNVSSVLGFLPAPYSALYSSTKHAVEGLSESLDHELRGMGIRVTLVEPAYTRTEFETNLIQPDQKLSVYDDARAGAGELMREVMLVADPAELVAGVVVKAATAKSPRHRYTAGKIARRVSVLRRFVPEAAFDRSLRKQLRLQD